MVIITVRRSSGDPRARNAGLAMDEPTDPFPGHCGSSGRGRGSNETFTEHLYGPGPAERLAYTNEPSPLHIPIGGFPVQIHKRQQDTRH